MSILSNRFWKVLAAVALALLAFAGNVAALEPAEPYRYTDTTYQVIVDSNDNRFEFITTGCGFVNGTNTIKQSRAYNPAKTSMEGSAYCESGGDTRPADAYWRTTDGRAYIVVSGSAAEANDVPAQSGIAGGVKLALFNEEGKDLKLHDVSLETETVDGRTVGVQSSSDLEFEGLCLQEAGTFSWLICPAINFANGFVDRLVDIVLDLLRTEPLLLNTPRGKGLYEAWSQFRTIANILLIPLFLFSIYALIFSSGNRYTVTRILPRLVVAALAMQLSFFFAAIIIDIGNVLASGLAGIFNFINDGIRDEMQAVINRPDLLTATAADRGVGAAVGTGLLIALGWLFVFGATPPGLIIITAFVAGIILTFLALALRQLVIVVMVVLSPLAMVFAVLPNTERWAREWFDNLVKLVLVYPLIVLFFSVASTLSLLALGTGQSEINHMIASLLPVVALISVPYIFRFAGMLFRNVSAVLSGTANKAKEGIVGDIRDPGSLAYRARMSKMWRRYQSTKSMANRPGLGWTAQFTQPIRKERDYYRLGGDSIADVFSAAFPGKLKRLVYGERPFNGRLGVENYTPRDILETNWAKRDIMRIRNTPGEMTSVMMGPFAQHAGGNFDRALTGMFGLSSMVQDGVMSYDNASEALLGFQAAVRGAQRWTNFVQPEDLTNPRIRTPRDMYNIHFGDYHGLDPRDQQTNLTRKQQVIRTGSGTLTDQQGEGTFKVVADALGDDRIIRQAQTDANFRGSVEALVLKAEALNTRLRNSGMTSGEIDAAIAQAGEDQDVGIAGFYGKSGVEIRAMREFIQRALDAKRQVGINTDNVDPSTTDV